MQWNNSASNPRPTLMNHLAPEDRRVVVDRAKKTVCVGSGCPRRAGVPTKPIMAQKTGNVYPMVQTKEQGILLIDTGTTYTQPITFRGQKMTLVGWTDTEYLDIDYDNHTIGFALTRQKK